MERTGMINGVAAPQTGKKLWQYLASTSACLMAVAVGMALAWTSPVLPKLYLSDSWLVITQTEGSWISSLLALGAIPGALPAGKMADALGRKKSLMLLSVPFLLAWSIIILASKVWLICVARFIIGIGVGASCVLVPTYVSEIAETSTRGTLGSFFQLFLTVGIVVAFALGNALNYTAFAISGALITVLFLATFVWMPESPVWLVGERRKPDATIALSVLRGDVYDPSEELADMQKAIEEASSRKSSVLDMVKERSTKRALMATLGAMIFQQLSGINAMIFYTVTIFKASGSTIPPEIASIIVASVQMIMSGVAALIVDRAGRKPLLMGSSSVTAICLAALGIYFKLKIGGSDVSSLSWLPLTALTVFMVAFSVGLGPIPWMLMGELFTTETKAIASSLAVMSNWFLAFVVTKAFPAMNDGLGPDITFWIFGVIMAISTAYTYFIVPETKGKSFQEIQDELHGGVRLNRSTS